MATQLDDALQRATTAAQPVPGVVGVVTDRERTTYVAAAGVRALDDGAAMTPDTVFAIFSATKAITGTAVLQLVERGELDLDAPADEYLPALGELLVLDGFDDAGPRLRAPRRAITMRMLLSHTAGFGYDFFNADYARLAREYGQPAITEATAAALRTPLLFDPGERWEYGSSIDWAGQVVEAVTGRRLGDVFAERIFEPLGMVDTSFELSTAMRSRRAGMHRRRPDGTLRTIPGFEMQPDPEIQMGGQGLYSTALDYAAFIRMWLADGRGPEGPVLRPGTVAMAAANGLGDIAITPLRSVNPALAHHCEFFPGVPKSWALTFLRTDADAPTGRSAGSLAWAGLANLYYWIDRRRGIGGFWAAQLFPFADPAAYAAYLEFETAAYAAISG